MVLIFEFHDKKSNRLLWSKTFAVKVAANAKSQANKLNNTHPGLILHAKDNFVATIQELVCNSIIGYRDTATTDEERKKWQDVLNDTSSYLSKLRKTRAPQVVLPVQNLESFNGMLFSLQTCSIANTSDVLERKKLIEMRRDNKVTVEHLIKTKGGSTTATTIKIGLVVDQGTDPIRAQELSPVPREVIAINDYEFPQVPSAVVHEEAVAPVQDPSLLPVQSTADPMDVDAEVVPVQSPEFWLNVIYTGDGTGYTPTPTVKLSSDDVTYEMYPKTTIIDEQGIARDVVILNPNQRFVFSNENYNVARACFDEGTQCDLIADIDNL